MKAFATIEEIRAHRFAGNYHQDGESFAAIDDFVKDVINTIEDRAEALVIMARDGMGLFDSGEDTPPKELVQQYLEST